jgi:hypothetical protein
MVAGAAQPPRLSKDKVARHTVRPCAQTADDRPAWIILVPPRGDLAHGFEMAKAKVASGTSVRIVGVGVTLPRSWPSWVTDCPILYLTELTAYRGKTLLEATQPLRDSLKALADELFAGAFSDLRGSEVFYPHIGMRAFASIAFVMPIALGLVEHHAHDVVTCTQPDWPGYALYRTLAGLAPARHSRLRWIGSVATLAVAGWIASLIRVVGMYWQSRIGLEEVRRRSSSDSIRMWLHLMPDWHRANAPLIEATRGRDVGALLHGHIGRGERDEIHLSTRRGRELWPGLRGLDVSRVHAWDTTSIPSSVGQFVRGCAMFTRNCAVATLRLTRRGPLLKLGSRELDLTPHVLGLAQLLTIDMARVCLADAATANVLRNREFVGTTVLFVGALLSDIALVVKRLHHAGATTIDFAHGWSGEPVPFSAESAAKYRCVWAHTDTSDGDVRFLVGGMPMPPRLARSPGGPRVRVLVMTNYAHRDEVEVPGLGPYQDEVLDIIRCRSHRYVFRWRPHPADSPEAVSRSAEGLPAELSRARPLAEDLAWADVVVSTISTALLHALLVDLPVLVHVTPDLEGAPQESPFSRDRTFFLASDGVEKLDAVVTALAAPDLLEPERRARTILFGETKAPSPLTEAVASLIPGAGPATSRDESVNAFSARIV